MSRSPYVKHLTRTLHFSYHGLEDRSSCNLPAEGDVMAWRCRNKGKLQRKAPSRSSSLKIKEFFWFLVSDYRYECARPPGMSQ